MPGSGSAVPWNPSTMSLLSLVRNVVAFAEQFTRLRSRLRQPRLPGRAELASRAARAHDRGTCPPCGYADVLRERTEGRDGQ